MIDVSTPPHIAAVHFMCSQSGNNISDLGGCSGSPSCIIGSDQEPDSTSRHDFISHPQPSDMGLRYMTLNSPDDVHFDTSSSTSPVCSLESSATIYTPSSFNFSPYSPLYHNGLSNTAYTNFNNHYYPPNTFSSLSDKQSKYNSFGTPSVLSQHPRTSALPPPPTSPINTRELYQGSVPLHLRRTSDLISRSPSLGSSLRGAPLSPISSSSYTTATTMDNTGNGGCPPLRTQSTSWNVQGPDGSIYQPEIYGKIDKGFFLTEDIWTCYRRNYFSLNCSYTIHPLVPKGNMKLTPGKEITQTERNLGADGAEVKAFAMCISATIDGEEGKPIELVQHTPKRDKGPQMRPERIVLHPRLPQQNTAWGDNSLGSSSRGLYDNQPFNPATSPPTEASFERIQFKNATANNGKRRAAQQYYHITVELWADLGSQHRGERWVKVAKRPSCPMVVRGRSPGHYQSERRGSNASSGPGSGGASGTGSYPSSSISRTPGDMNIGGSSSILSPQSAYGSNYENRSHNTQLYYRPNLAGLTPPMEALMPEDAQKAFQERTNYTYHYGAIYEGQENRYQRPNAAENMSSGLKFEHHSNNQTTLPSISSTGAYDEKTDRWGFSLKSEPHYSNAQFLGAH